MSACGAAPQLKLQLLPTGQPTVLLEVEPRRPGGHRLRLHSGVRLVNATDLHLRIGYVPIASSVKLMAPGRA